VDTAAIFLAEQPSWFIPFLGPVIFYHIPSSLLLPALIFANLLVIAVEELSNFMPLHSLLERQNQ
jgi:hypothetical protein